MLINFTKFQLYIFIEFYFTILSESWLFSHSFTVNVSIFYLLPYTFYSLQICVYCFTVSCFFSVIIHFNLLENWHFGVKPNIISIFSRVVHSCASYSSLCAQKLVIQSSVLPPLLSHYPVWQNLFSGILLNISRQSTKLFTLHLTADIVFTGLRCAKILYAILIM